jgi:dGTPase
MKHQTPWDQNHKEFKGASLEAAVVNLADEIAYTNHDVDDGLRSGILKERDLEPLELWQNAAELVFNNYEKIPDPSIRWSRLVSQMIGVMIQDLIAHSSQKIDSAHLKSPEDVYRSSESWISFSPKQAQSNREMQSFLMKNLYFHPRVLKRSQNGQKILEKLFKTYHKKHEKLPLEAQLLIRSGEKPEIVIKDYIAGMTDEFAKKSLKEM